MDTMYNTTSSRRKVKKHEEVFLSFFSVLNVGAFSRGLLFSRYDFFRRSLGNEIPAKILFPGIPQRIGR